MSVVLSTLAVVGFNLCGRVVGMVTLFISRYLLGPEHSGVWNLIQIISGYTATVSSGIELGAEREIPYWHGKGDYAREAETRNQMFSGVFIEAVVIALLTASIAFLSLGHYRKEITDGLFWAAAYVILWRVSGCFVIALKTTRNFVLLSRSQMLFAIFDLVVIAILTYEWRLRGQCTAFAMSMGSRIFFYWCLVRQKALFTIRWQWKPHTLFPLLKVGAPLMVGGLLWQWLVSVDSLLIGKILTMEMLGYYSLGLSASRTIAEIPTAFGAVVFPELIINYGRNESRKELGLALARNLEVVVFFIAPCIISLYYFLFPMAIRQFLTQFLLAIPVVQILSISGIILSLTHLANQLFIALKQGILVASLFLLACLQTTGIVYLACAKGISQVAVAVTISYAIYLSTIVFVAFWQTIGLRMALRFYCKFALGFTYMVLILQLVDRLSIVGHASLTSDICSTLIKMGLSLVGFVGLFWKANRDLAIISRLKMGWAEVVKRDRLNDRNKPHEAFAS